MDELWQRVWATSPPPSPTTLVLTGLVALAAVGWGPAWGLARHLVTVVHEGAHALVALACGRSLAGVRLHSDSSGLTLSRGRARGAGMVATLFAGYVGPGLLGLAVAAVIGWGHAVAALWGLLALLALLLLEIRNLYGLWVLLVTGVALGGVTWWGSAALQSGTAAAVAWFLLLAAPWKVVELQRARGGGRARDSDPDQLARLTVLPAGLWVALMLLVTLATLVLGGRLMLRT